MFEPVTKPQHQYYLSLETPGRLNKFKNIPWDILKNIVFINLRCSGTSIYRFLKRRAPKNDEDSRNKIFKIIDMRSISIKKHEIDI